MYIRRETRHFQGQSYRDSWGSESSSGGRESAGNEGGGVGGGGLGGIGGGQSPGAYSGASRGDGAVGYVASEAAPSMTPKATDWETFVKNSPSPWQAAKLFAGMAFSPVTGTYAAFKFNQERLAKMSPSEIENERAIQKEISAIRAGTDSGQGGYSYSPKTYGGLQFANGNGTIQSPSFISGSAGVSTGVAASGGEVVGTPQSGENSGGAGAGAGGLLVAQESPLGKLAALATIAAVLLQVMG